MTDHLYVATDAHGVQRANEKDVVWDLPAPGGAPGGATAEAGPLVLSTALVLLEELGERIFIAEPGGAAVVSTDRTGSPEPSGTGSPERSGIVTASAARLVAETAWGVERAAHLALDCAEHVLGDASGTVLPGGATLGEVVAEARRVLGRSSDGAEQRLGVLARLSAARRLRRQGEVLGDLALEALNEDLTGALDALDDPAWATVASARDAVLGAVEAVRHLALPRYVEARERAYEDNADEAESSRGAPTGMFMTPWGPIVLGAEHQSGYAPAWVAARDSAMRARDAVLARDGEQAAAQERVWQAGRLEELLLPATGG